MKGGLDPNEKVALITGGARGIGYETARQLHERGAAVTVVDLDPAETSEAAERIGERALGVAADVTDQAAISQAVAATVERFGGLDVAVANAGIGQSTLTTMRGIDGGEWERVLEIDLLGVWRTVRAVLPQIVERQGHVVVASSVFAFLNGALNSPYAVSKAGVEALGRALRVELQSLGASAGVTYFGAVDTRMVQDAAERRHGDRVADNTPRFMQRRIGPDEAGAAVVRAIEKRASRTFGPRWWRYAAAMRGILNPVLDRQAGRSPELTALLREIEAETDERGAAAVSAVSG